MPETRTIAIEVLRYQPAEASQPYLQTWSVPFTDDMSVLQGLQYIKDHLDGSLTFRWSCRMAICGSCGMMIGGVPRLGCRTFLRHFLPGPLRIEALARVHQLDLGKRHAGRFHRLDRRIEGAGVPGHRDRLVA